MISLEVFRDYMDEILEELPEEFFRELNGGVLLKEEKRFHPQSRKEDLCIMGEYRREYGLGRYIILYYGSFEYVYSHLPEEALRKVIKKTLLHEFRHHLEYLAGEKDLEVEDAVKIEKYKKGCQ